MKTEWDEAKRLSNMALHGPDFAEFAGFDETPLVFEDDRADYGEQRFVGLGPIAGRLHVLVFTYRADTMRLISLRKANAKEGKLYDRAKA